MMHVILFISLINFSLAFIGVIRHKNGTDVELMKWYKNPKRCGETTLLTNNGLIVYNDTVCGYECSWQNAQPYSSYEINPQGGLTCESDTNIRQSKLLVLSNENR